MSERPPKPAARQKNVSIVAPDAQTDTLSAQERKTLARCENSIEQAVAKVTSGFREMAEAFYEIREQRLYRETSSSFAAYFRTRLGYGRSHANRIADAGAIIHDLSPQGDILEAMTSEAHFRPLAALGVDERQKLIALAESWRGWHRESTVEPSLLRSAKAFLQPLHDRMPKRYFVNSMSDLFHDKVPDSFIEAVFEVMKKAHWHHFQVLTKRPKRMAAFTMKYFRNETPPPNIWLGTSTENQDAFNERIGWLRQTRAAVRWLSCEPLLGPIRFDSAEGIDWVVVGGESDSHRRMEKKWAAALRDQCGKHDIAYFFKQWGSFDEQGDGPKKEKHDDLNPPTLDGVIHDAFPAQLI